MKSSTINFATALAIGIALLAVNTASAGFGFGGGNGGGHGGGHGGGVKFSFGGGNNHHDNHAHHKQHHHDWHHKFYHQKYYYQRPYVRYYSQPAPVIVSAPVIPTAPLANISLAAEEPARTQIQIGSVLVLDGQPLGSTKGTVRLLVGNLAMPVEVLEWTSTAAKIRMPMMDLAGPMKADLEVLRADGSLASSSPIEVTPAAPQIATSN